jgi:arabinogalactan endo-1,4-beta-galactosidase
MKRFMVEFKITDHFADDAGELAPTQQTLVEAVNKEQAIRQFCSDMVATYECSYSILDVRERFW